MEKEKIPDKDLILFDWFTCRIRGMEVDDIVELLGMRECSWEEFDYGLHGYRQMVSVGGVKILSSGTAEMGVCIEMSGQGCRYYETYGYGDWTGLLRFALSDPENIKLTRLDVAFDDHSGCLDMDQLFVDTDQQNYVSRSRTWEIVYGSKGTSLYYGSKQSNTLIRIYDKAAERGFDPELVHWLRLELQLRDEIAQGFARGLDECELGVMFRGVLRRYLRFCVPSEDTNKSRWATAPYWDEFLQQVAAIRCWEAPGVEYNMENLDRLVFDMCGNGLLTYVRAYGVEALMKQLLSRFDVSKYPKKYSLLLQDRFFEVGHLKYLDLMDLFEEWGGRNEKSC